MKFNSCEQRARIQFVEQTQSEVAETLRWPEVKDVLGATALRLAHITEFLYVPNIKNGVISVPKEQQSTNHIPVIPFSYGEQYSLDTSLKGFAPAQWDNLAAALSSAAFIQWGQASRDYRMTELENKLKQSKRTLDMYSTRKAWGGVISSGHAQRFPGDIYPGLRSNEQLYIMGHPVIYIKKAQSEAQAEARNVVLVHELKHVDQMLTTPFLPEDIDSWIDARWRQELEAYHVHTQYGNALFWSNDSRYWMRQGLRMLRIVELIRKKYADPDDPFAPLLLIRDAVKRIGLEDLGTSR